MFLIIYVLAAAMMAFAALGIALLLWIIGLAVGHINETRKQNGLKAIEGGNFTEVTGEIINAIGSHHPPSAMDQIPERVKRLTKFAVLSFSASLALLAAVGALALYPGSDLRFRQVAHDVILTRDLDVFLYSNLRDPVWRERRQTPVAERLPAKLLKGECFSGREVTLQGETYIEFMSKNPHGWVPRWLWQGDGIKPLEAGDTCKLPFDRSDR